jgi:hypothetical protein
LYALTDFSGVRFHAGSDPESSLTPTTHYSEDYASRGRDPSCGTTDISFSTCLVTLGSHQPLNYKLLYVLKQVSNYLATFDTDRQVNRVLFFTKIINKFFVLIYLIAPSVIHISYRHVIGR